MAKIDVKAFAERTERLCDFLLAKLAEEKGMHGSPDQLVLQDLKEEAATIQAFGIKASLETLDGLSDYMAGVPKES